MITLELLRRALTDAPARQRGEQAKNTQKAIQSVLDGTATPATTQIVHQTIARLYGVPDGRAE